MTDEDTTRSNRRTVLKGLGAGVTGSVAFSGTGAAFGLGDVLSGTLSLGGTLIDDALDPDSDALQEVIVVFESNDDAARLETLDVDLAAAFDVLPMAFARLPGTLIETVAGWDSVRYVSSNYEVELYNADARRDTNAGAVQAGEGLETAYTGENVHVALIDSGIDGSHDDLGGKLQGNYQFVGIPELQSEPLWWQDLGGLDSDTSGHGTHCAGSVGGTGSRNAEHTGMAPGADLTMYSVGVGGLLLVFIAAAYDDLLRRQREGEHDVQVVSNSYGPTQSDQTYVPDDPINVATWEAHKEGILPVFAAGNSGPDDGTLSQYAKAPHVLGVGATDDEEAVADFSSRGRPQDGSYDVDNYDRVAAYENLESHYEDDVPVEEIDGPLGIYRPGVAAKGDGVVSTLNPLDLLNLTAPDSELYYGSMSGTSMSCPVTAGCAALVYDAAIENGQPTDPMDVLVTLEAEADEQRRDAYAPEAVGSGYVDALGAVERAETGEFASYDEVALAGGADSSGLFDLEDGLAASDD